MRQTIRPDGRGFTLIEMMMTVVIIGILAAIALPGYVKTRERSYWQAAESILLAIYAGERAYFLVNNTYRGPLTAGSSMAEWRLINIDNPNLASIPVSYSVTAAATTFTATAERPGGPCPGSTRTVNQDRVLLPIGSCWCGSC